METGGIVPDAVETQIEEAEKQRADQRCEGRVEATGEGLLNESAKKYLLADWIKENRGQGVEAEKAKRGYDPAHLVDVKIVADAYAPVIRRVAVNNHAKDEEDARTDGACKRAGEHGGEGRSTLGQANFAAAGGGKEEEWER